MVRARPTRPTWLRRSGGLAAGFLLALSAAGCTGPLSLPAGSPGSPATTPGAASGTAPVASPSLSASPSLPSGSAGPATAAVPAAGGSSTCLLDAGGGLSCWGAGLVGDGTLTPQFSPRHVVGLTSGVTSVAIGREHGCVVAQGGVKCWGTNDDGAVGDGTRVARVIAVPVPELASGVSAVVAGSDHSCALTAAGGVMCWGSNAAGQLGDGTRTDRVHPTEVAGLAGGVVALAAGDDHTCAVTSAGGVVCWGQNSSGQLGDSTTADRTRPVKVVRLDDPVSRVSAGTTDTCALTTSGGVLCWGENAHGQVGDGTTTRRSTPVAVRGLDSGITDVAVGEGHVCALTASGAVECWGANVKGQLGDGTSVHRPRPTPVSGLQDGVEAIAVGWSHSCALTNEGSMVCWGGDNVGQLGDGGAARLQLTPHPVSPVPAAGPDVRQQSDDFAPGSTSHWWVGCDKTGCTSMAHGVFTVRQKKAAYRHFQAFEDFDRLRSVSMTFDLRKLSTTATESSVGLACMIAGDPGSETAYYDLRLRNDGGISIAKYSDGAMSSVADWPGTPGNPVRTVSLGCQAVAGKVLLTGRLPGHVYTVADTKAPIAAGRAAMTIGQRGNGSSVTVLDGIDVVAEVEHG